MQTHIEFRPATYAAMIVAVLLSSAATYLLTDSTLATVLANSIAFSLLALLYIELQYHEIDDRRALARFLLDIRRPTRKHALLALGAVAIGVVVRIGVGTVKSILTPTQATAGHSVTQSTAPAGTALLATIVAVVVLGPLVEELVFRGLLQRLLTRHTGAAAAIGVTAVTFAVLHIPNYGGFGTPVGRLAVPMAVLTADSVVWGWLYDRSGNVAVSWLAHAGSNAVALLLWIV